MCPLAVSYPDNRGGTAWRSWALAEERVQWLPGRWLLLNYRRGRLLLRVEREHNVGTWIWLLLIVQGRHGGL